MKQTPTKSSISPLRGLVALLPFLWAGCASTTGDRTAHEQHAGAAGGAEPTHTQTQTHTAAADTRIMVRFPDAMRVHTLANMRDHLLAVAEIQQQLAQGGFDQASEIAEQRLGMTSLRLHGAHDVAAFMPPGMQGAGTALHRSASQFAIVAKNASVTGDVKASLAALAQVTQTCVACHAAYRIQ